MPPLLIEFVMLLCVGCVGTGVGWWLKSRFQPATGLNPTSEEPEESPSQDHTQTASILDNLKALAENIAFDVEEHSESVQRASEQLQSDSDHTTEVVISTIAQIVESNKKLQQRLEEAEEKLQNQAAEIEAHVHEARTDALTSVANRRAFDSEIAEAERAFQRDGTPVSVMMIDVDRFKKFNDTFGHQAGDEVLKNVARMLRRKVKRSGLVARYGGEEFSVIFRNQTIDQCKQKAELARAAIADMQIHFEGKDLCVTASAGLAELRDGERVEEQIKRADAALYASKEAGRDCAHWHDGCEIHQISLPEPAPLPASNFAGDTDSFGELQEGDNKNLPGIKLPNREAFEHDLTRRIAEWKRGGNLLSVVLLTIDGLDEIVQQRGTKAMNILMKTTAQFLKASTRDMDLIAHFEDQRFAVLLPQAALVHAVTVSERLRKAIARCRIPLDGQAIQFTVSVGTAEVESGDSCESLMQRTNQWLQEASTQGGNVSCYDQALYAVCEPEEQRSAATN